MNEICALWYREAHTCPLLDSHRCRGLNISCGFYRTEKDAQEQHERWKRRMCSLPPVQQSEIADKYYHGHMPWKGDT